MREIITLKGMTKKILALVVFVKFLFRVNCHNVFYKVKVTERNSCFKRVYRDTSVSTENIIHMKFMHSLY